MKVPRGRTDAHLTKFAQASKATRVPEDDELLTARELSNQSGVPLSTLNRWVREGRIQPARKLPGRTGAYLFPLDAVLEVRGGVA